MLSGTDRNTLLDIARSSVRYGLEHGRALPVIVTDYAHTLQANKASFVTLRIGDDLRGCIGTLEAYRPLVEDVAENAYAAAFRDPRFPPLDKHEYSRLAYHISILSEPEALHFTSEADLLQQLRPGVDGIVLQEGAQRGTFLPQVWESLPEPAMFLRHLKQKAGLSPDYWSNTLKAQRYTVDEF